MLFVAIILLEWMELAKPISGRTDRASASEAVDLGSIRGRVKPKTIIIGIHSFCEALPCVIDMWASSNLTRRPKGPFAVTWPSELGE